VAAPTLLQALGVRIDCKSQTAVRCLRELGICFLFAPQYHPALARVAPIRRVLGIRTTLNLVGPMVNPARAQYRLLGVADQARMSDVAGALSQIGVTRAWVLRGTDGLDEITTAGATQVLEVRAAQVKPLFTVSPQDFGLAATPTARRGPTARKKPCPLFVKCSQASVVTWRAISWC